MQEVTVISKDEAFWVRVEMRRFKQKSKASVGRALYAIVCGETPFLCMANHRSAYLKVVLKVT